jgi:hypothetical protein
LNFLENSWRYSQVKVHHRDTSRKIATGINDTGVKFSMAVIDTSGKQ